MDSTRIELGNQLSSAISAYARRIGMPAESFANDALILSLARLRASMDGSIRSGKNDYRRLSRASRAAELVEALKALGWEAAESRAGLFGDCMEAALGCLGTYHLRASGDLFALAFCEESLGQSIGTVRLDAVETRQCYSWIVPYHQRVELLSFKKSDKRLMLAIG